MTYLQKYVFQKKQKTKCIYVKAFKMIKNKNEGKTLVFVNASPIVQHVIQFKNGIMKYVNVNVKVIASAKKIIVVILAHVLVRIASILKVLLILQ